MKSCESRKSDLVASKQIQDKKYQKTYIILQLITYNYQKTCQFTNIQPWILRVEKKTAI